MVLLDNLIGLKLTEDRLESLRLAYHAIRVIRPGTVYTMELRMGRLNVHVDAEDVISKISWG